MKPIQVVLRSVVALGGAGLLAGGCPVRAQQPITGLGSTVSRAPDPRSSPEMPDLSPDVQRNLDRGRQAERQRRMVADTDRLLALAAQLKAATDKTAKDPSAADMIRKADEIEKLARSVKDRMKG